MTKKELPKGFRITKRVREILIPRICYEKFDSRVDFMIRKESFVFRQVIEFLLPSEKRKEIEAIAATLPLKVTLPTVARFHLRSTNYKNHSYYIGSHNCMPGTMSRIITDWHFQNSLDSEVVWPGAKDSKQYHNTDRRYVLHSEGSYHNDIAVKKEDLPIKLRRLIFEFIAESAKLNQEFNQFHDLAQRSIFEIKSAKQLKEFSPKVYDILCDIADDIKPPCSDIPLADTSNELEHLL
jgi:hypothetical protein